MGFLHSIASFKKQALQPIVPSGHLGEVGLCAPQQKSF
jgi:hypothetical protein